MTSGTTQNMADMYSFHTMFASPIRTISSSEQSSGRAIALPQASAPAKCYRFYVKVFYVMDKALAGDRAC